MRLYEIDIEDLTDLILSGLDTPTINVMFDSIKNGLTDIINTIDPIQTNKLKEELQPDIDLFEDEITRLISRPFHNPTDPELINNLKKAKANLRYILMRKKQAGLE